MIKETTQESTDRMTIVCPECNNPQTFKVEDMDREVRMMQAVFGQIKREASACFMCQKHKDQPINFFGITHGFLCNVCIFEMEVNRKSAVVCKSQDIVDHA